MNFLAHLFLSGENEKVKIGNFIGDFVKGNKLEEYDQEIQFGIRLHREIDSYTDSHPVVLESKTRLNVADRPIISATQTITATSTKGSSKSRRRTNHLDNKKFFN